MHTDAAKSDTAHNPSLDTGDLSALIDSFSELIERMGPDYAAHGDKLSEIAERLSRGWIHLAVLGQFKRGKSSLLNALLGEPVLPTAAIPLTSVPTYIRFGERRRACISFDNDCGGADFASNSADEIRAFLSKYVSEEENPGNGLGVSGVELFFDSPFLRHGVVLIDTPGIGSTHLHNTEATLNFLPRCDAALFLVSADPPITEVELQFLAEVRKKIGTVLFVLNKVDYLEEDERDQVIAFILRVLREKTDLPANPVLFPLSARDGLRATHTNDTELLARSGVETLTRYLGDFMAHKKRAVLAAALTAKTADIVSDFEMQVRLALRSFRIPFGELGEKLGLFEKKIAESEYQKVLSSDILAGERKRLIELLENQSESLRVKAGERLASIVRDYFSRGGVVREDDIRMSLSEEIPVFFERELGELSRFFDTRVAGKLELHRNRADDIIESVRRCASDIFSIPFHARKGPAGIEIVREPYWVIHHWKASLAPIPEEWIDRILPHGVKERRIRKRVDMQVKNLVMRNVENLRWSTLQNLDQTFRRFMADLDERFTGIIRTTREVVRLVMEKRKLYADHTSGEIANLEGILSRVEEMQSMLKKNDVRAPEGDPHA